LVTIVKEEKRELLPNS